MNERDKELWSKAAEATKNDSWDEQVLFMQRFAELIRADERETCAKACESNVWSKNVAWWKDATKSEVSVESGVQCAAAIRARGAK